MKLGLYSITYLGVWYDGPALTLSEVIQRASRFGYQGIEIDGKRPHGHPLDLTTGRCRELSREARDCGIEIYAMAANNDFSNPVTELRESQLAYVRDMIRLTADLGAPTLRVFAAWPGVYKGEGAGSYDIAEAIWTASHHQFSPQQIWEWCRDGLAEAANWAADAGVVLALQNHRELINSYADVLRMIADVGSPSLKAAFDAPLGYKQGIRDMRRAAAEVGPLQVLTHFGGEYEEDGQGNARGFVRWRNGRIEPETFYQDFALGMKDIGYEGYTGYELCHPLPLIDGKPAGLNFVDRNVDLAARFMRRVIAETENSHTHPPVPFTAG